MPVWLIILLVIVAIHLLSQIPVWVYLMLGGIGFCVALTEAGAFARIGNWLRGQVCQTQRWWHGLPEDRRRRLRKGTWRFLAILCGIYLAIVYPVTVLSVVAAVLALRWALRHRAARRSRKQVLLLPAPLAAEFGERALSSPQ